MAKLRYFDAGKPADPEPAPVVPTTGHSEFLRTGRINRNRPHWLAEEREYLSHEHVAERTALKLRDAGEKTHDRLTSFHHTLKDTPHLGYCHVTAARTQFAQYEQVNWAFYIANFFARIGQEENFFEDISLKYSRMYFAVAVHPDKQAEDKKLTINRDIRGNGVLFHTHDPQIAIRNVLLLGARNEQLRDIIRQL